MTSKTERLNFHYMADAMRRLEWDLHQAILSEQRIPPEWHQIARARPEPKKARVTMMIDEDVLRFFRAMGRRYQPRMNEVLRAFMHARLAGVVQGGETMDYLRAEGPRPDWGATQAEIEDLAPGAARLMSDEPGVPMEGARPSTRARLEALRQKMAARDAE